MAKGQHLSGYQQKIVKRYYQNLDAISVQKLAELVSEIAISTEPKKLDKLWDRARIALSKVEAPDGAVDRVLNARDVKALAALVGKLSA